MLDLPVEYVIRAGAALISERGVRSGYLFVQYDCAGDISLWLVSDRQRATRFSSPNALDYIIAVIKYSGFTNDQPDWVSPTGYTNSVIDTAGNRLPNDAIEELNLAELSIEVL